MRTLRYLLRKEFIRIFRNKTLLPMIFSMPIIQLMVLPWAADYEIKHLDIAIVDTDHSATSRRLTDKLTSSGYFRLAARPATFDGALALVESDRADLVLEIPRHFERDLTAGHGAQLFTAVNAINGVKAGLGSAYLAQVVATFADDLRLDRRPDVRMSPAPTLRAVPIRRFNPAGNYRFFMVPAVLTLLVTMISTYLCALNLVSEKEMGTIEQMNVTPVGKYVFLLSKTIPFLLIGIFIFSVGLYLIARPLYGIIPVGHVSLLYAYLLLYLTAMLGLGLLISTYCETQQQVMFVTFFFMTIFILMSGLFTPVESMPAWARAISRSNPVTYFMEACRMIVLKGSAWRDVRSHVAITAGFALVFHTWAALNYRKTT